MFSSQAVAKAQAIVIVVIVVGAALGLGTYYSFLAKPTPTTPAALTTFVRTTQTPTAPTLQKVRLGYDWVPGGRFSFIYVGIEKGFYKEVGLDVEDTSFRGSLDAAKNLASGSLDFTATDFAAVMNLRAGGAKIKSIMLIYAKSPLGLATLDPNLKSPKDLEGRNIGVTSSSNSYYVMAPFAKINKIDLNQIKLTDLSAAVYISALWSGQVDAVATWDSASFQAQLAASEKNNNRPVYALWLRDWGLNVATANIATTDEMLQKNPTLVKNFLKATIKSIQYTFANQNEAVQITVKNHQELTAKDSIAQFEAAKNLADGGQLWAKNGLGWHDPAVMKLTYDTYAQAYKAENVPIDDMYTNSYLPGP